MSNFKTLPTGCFTSLSTLDALNFSHSGKYAVVPHCDFNYILLINNAVGHFFIHSLLWNAYFNFLPIFGNRVLVFSLLIAVLSLLISNSFYILDTSPCLCYITLCIYKCIFIYYCIINVYYTYIIYLLCITSTSCIINTFFHFHSLNGIFFFWQFRLWFLIGKTGKPSQHCT